MTHDQLLDALDFPWVDVLKANLRAEKYKQALRAVVELHKPREITLPNGEWGANCGHCDIGFTYPCPTIQAIEKELK